MLRALVLSSVLLLGCNDSKEYLTPGPVPTIVAIVRGTEADGGTAPVCSLAEGGGNCPLPLKVTFRLAQNSIVTKAIVRFQGDQNDEGVDHGYVTTPTPGMGDGTDVTLEVDAAVPSTILRAGALYTYSVRLLTAAGDYSLPTSLTIAIP